MLNNNCELIFAGRSLSNATFKRCARTIHNVVKSETTEVVLLIIGAHCKHHYVIRCFMVIFVLHILNKSLINVSKTCPFSW